MKEPDPIPFKNSVWISAGLLGAGSLWAWFLLSLPPPVACESKPQGACKPMAEIQQEYSMDAGAAEIAACKEGYALACLNAGDIHANGQHGRKKSLLEAEAYYSRACGMNLSEGCARLQRLPASQR